MSDVIDWKRVNVTELAKILKQAGDVWGHVPMLDVSIRLHKTSFLETLNKLHGNKIMYYKIKSITADRGAYKVTHTWFVVWLGTV